MAKLRGGNKHSAHTSSETVVTHFLVELFCEEKKEESVKENVEQELRELVEEPRKEEQTRARFGMRIDDVEPPILRSVPKDGHNGSIFFVDQKLHLTQACSLHC